MTEPMITVYDATGQQLSVPREQWRTNILPGALQRAWHDPDALAREITQGLQDDFAADVLPAARRLLQLAPRTERGGVLLAVCLLDTGQHDEAQQVLQDVVAAHPDSAPAWTNLAKLAHGRGDPDAELAHLERAVAADPNYSVSLNYLAGLRAETDGAAGRVRVMQTAAGQPGAWRPQLWLGQAALDDDDTHAALRWYTQALDRAPDEPDALMQATGDLGRAGRLEDMLRLGGPRYRAEVHGLPAGLNLLEASLTTGRIEQAAALLHRLYLLDRPDLRTRLHPYADRLDRLRAERAPAPAVTKDGTPPITVLAATDPVWWRWLAEPAWLLPPAAGAPVLFVPLSVAARTDEQAGQQRTEWRGRVARGVPLYLTDLTRMSGRPAGFAVLVVPNGGAVLSGAPDTEGSVATLVQVARVAPSAVVTGTVGGTPEHPLVTIELRRSPDWTATAARSDLTPRRVWPALRDLLPEPAAASPPVPADDVVDRVVAEYDTLLSFVLAARGVVSADSLWGERASIDFLLDTLAQHPEPLAAMHLLAALTAMTAYGSPIPAEYHRRVGEALDRFGPDGLITSLRPLTAALAGTVPEVDVVAPPAYREWLTRLRSAWWT